jgi:hypothetical protein
VTFEKIVRPFQSPDPFNPRVLPPFAAPGVVDVPTEAGTEADEGHVVIKGSADGSYSEGPPLVGVEFKIKWEEDESQRKTEKVRIENADDPDQYLEVQRIVQMVLKNSHTQEEIKIKPKF